MKMSCESLHQRTTFLSWPDFEIVRFVLFAVLIELPKYTLWARRITAHCWRHKTKAPSPQQCEEKVRLVTDELNSKS
jgi:hypothetical protein